MLLFNPLQIDFQFNGAAAISIQESVESGKDHCVFSNDVQGYVQKFLHKQIEESLRQMEAVNEQESVDLDTGAIMMDAQLLQSLYGLISTGGKVDDAKFAQFVNDKARISFYGDFLYPLATSFLNSSFRNFAYKNGLKDEDIWNANEKQDLWNAKLFPISSIMEEAVQWALFLYKMSAETVESAEVQKRKDTDRLSLCESFNVAEMKRVMAWQEELECRILCRKYIDKLSSSMDYREALNVFGTQGMTEQVYHTLMMDAENADFSLKICIYYSVSRYMKTNKVRYEEHSYDYPENLCFQTIQNVMYEQAVEKLPDASSYRQETGGYTSSGACKLGRWLAGSGRWASISVYGRNRWMR